MTVIDVTRAADSNDVVIRRTQYTKRYDKSETMWLTDAEGFEVFRKLAKLYEKGKPK